MWKPTTDKKYGVAIYNVNTKVPHGLSLEIGETVQILEEYGPGSWYRGFSTRNKNFKGIFPASYIHIIDCKVDPDGLLETVTPIENPFVTEVTYVLREWSLIWKNHFKDSHPPHRSMFMSIRQVMIELMEFRCQLKSGTCTQEQVRETEMRIAKKIDWGNKRLGLDLVPRIDGTIVDPDQISPVELYSLHVQSTKMSEGVGSGSVRKTFSRRVLTHHLYMSLKSFGASCGEDMEIYMALYDAKESQFISERAVFKFSKSDLPATSLKVPQSVLFTDLGNADLSRDMYLVIHIYRMGRMLPNDSSKRVNVSSYRRPWGCAVQGLREMTLISYGDDESGRDFNMRITSVDERAEKDFPQLHENLIKKQSSKGSVLSSNMLVSVRMFHGELAQVKRENPLLLKRTPLALKQGFSDIILPGDIRNDVYLLLSFGTFGDKANNLNKSTAKNNECQIVLFDSNGKLLKDCIYGAVGEAPTSEYRSAVFYHSNTPRWNETLKLTIPTDIFEGCHVRFEFRHCSTKDRGVEKKLFAFAFMKLMKNDGITINDGPHELYCYKCEDVSKLKQEYYINLPSSSEDVNLAAGTTGGNTFFSRCQKDNILVETRLCSTKLTQNVDLLGLLKWRQHPGRIKEYLDKVEGLSGDEIVKMLQDILDALFSIFSEVPPGEGGQAHTKAAFHTLVHILNLLQEQKYEHFKTVLESYVKESFSSSLVYRDLIRSLIDSIESVHSTGPDRSEEIERVFRSLTFIFKFIVQSRILYQRASGGHSTDEQFREELFTLFNSVYTMLSIPSQNLINAQNTFLENIITVHTVLLQLVSVDEVATFMCTLINRVPRDAHPKLTDKKLECIQKLVNTDLFAEEDARSKLLSMCMSQVKHYFIKKSGSDIQLGLCAEIIGDILIVLKRQKQAEQIVDQDVGQLVTSIMDVIVKVVQVLASKGEPSATKRADVAGKLVSCLIGLLKIMEESHYHDYLKSFSNKVPLKDFLVGIMSVFRLLVQQHVFPKDWIVMRLETDNTILTAMRYFSVCLNDEFLDAKNFSQELWTLYFQVAVNFLIQQSLQLEMYIEAKKEKIIEKFGDMRVRMGFEIISMWGTLGEHKIKFIPKMVGPFLQVTLIAETELRRAMLPLFSDMMECEQRDHGHFKMVESELIDKLDIQVSQNKGDDEYKELFNTILLERVQKEPSWQTNGTQFIKSVTSLLERLLDYRNVMDGDENRGKKMTCTFNLLNFYKNEFNREEMYIRYIYKLCDLHLAARNFTEAGHTLKLHADLLQWGQDAMMHAEESYPSQREWQRKEQLYQQIIEYFDQGKSWEYGIPLCKELAELYEKKFDYAKLSSILQTQATFFQNILTQLRQGSEYYRVGFYGKRFPLFLRNKVFVYRGDEYEKLGPFTRRLQDEFPSAELLNTIDPPDDDLRSSDMQYIQVCNVTPVPSDKEEFRAQNVPEQILSFYKKNAVSKFESSRPFHRGVKDKNCEFKTLCLEKTTNKISSPLPGILRWFEVTDTTSTVLNPIQTAIETVRTMNKVLKKMVISYTRDPKQTLHPFTMRLNGTIDAAVNGGLTKYKEAFFSPAFALEYPDEAQHIRNLKVAFGEQVEILKGGLSLHGRLVTPEMQPLHQNMMTEFPKMEKSIMDDVPKIDLRDLSGMSQTSLLDQPNCDSAYSSPRVSVSSSNSVRLSSSSTPRFSTPSDSARAAGETIPERHVDSALFRDDDDIYTDPNEIFDEPVTPRSSPSLTRSVSVCIDDPSSHQLPPKLPRRPATTMFTGILERQNQDEVPTLKEKVKRTVSDSPSRSSSEIGPRGPKHVRSSPDMNQTDSPPPLPQRHERKTKLHFGSDPFPPSYPNKPIPKARQTIHGESKMEPEGSPTGLRTRKTSVPCLRGNNTPPKLPLRTNSPQVLAKKFSDNSMNVSPQGDHTGRSSPVPPQLPERSPAGRRPSLPNSSPAPKIAHHFASVRSPSSTDNNTSVSPTKQSSLDSEGVRSPPPLPPNKPSAKKTEGGGSAPPPLPPRPHNSKASNDSTPM